MSETGLWAMVVLLAGVTVALLLRQTTPHRNRHDSGRTERRADLREAERGRTDPSRTAQAGPRPVGRRGPEATPPERIWLRAGEVAHTIDTAGPDTDAAVVLGPTTLADLLFEHPSQAGARMGAALDAADLHLGRPRPIADAIVDLLDLPITGLVLQAWTGRPAIEAACARTQGVPGATAFVVITGHTLRSRQRAQICLDVDGRPEVVLELDLAVVLTIDAVTITVIEGRVTGCVAGTTASTVELGVVEANGQVRSLVRRHAGQADVRQLAPERLAR
jgi:hypothetical protein